MADRHSSLVMVLFALVWVSPVDTEARELGVRYSVPAQHDVGEEDNWNSHIDNQAYLNSYWQRKNSPGAQVRGGSPVIIVNRNAHQSFRHRYRPGWCDSWGVTYRQGDTWINYRQNYRPNCGGQVIIVPDRDRPRPTPYIKKEKGRTVWSTGR